MKSRYLLAALLLTGINSIAQVGVGTVSPNSTLDVRGSLSTAYRSFTSATSITASDHILVFTGTTATTITLPTAVGVTGRSYIIKNASTTIPTPVLTLATTSSQNIDGLTTWTLDDANESIIVISNNSNWQISALTLPTGSGTDWTQGGNSVPAERKFGTLSNYALPFITNNVERMRISNTGNLAIGSSTFNGTYPERLLVDAGTTSSVNAIVGKGTINSYLQLNIQNLSNGSSASSDVVATADNGSETTNYVDMGINSSTNSSNVMGAANDAYLYNIGQNLLIGTGSASKSLVFMTGGTTQSANERMRIDGSGFVGIGINSPSYKLHVVGTNPVFLAGVQTGSASDSLLTITNGVVRKMLPAAMGAWTTTGNAGLNATNNFLGTTDATALAFRVNNSQVSRFEQNSVAIGLGATTNNSTQSYSMGSAATVGFNKTNAFAVGNSAAVNSDNSFAIGNSAVVNGTNSFAIGNNAAANNASSVAIGSAATTAYSIADAVAIGTNATASGNMSLAIGSHATAASKTTATQTSSVAIGTSAISNSANGLAIGTGADVGFSLTNALAIGSAATVDGNNAVAVGAGAIVGFGANSTAIGANSSVTAANSTAIGYNASATLANTVIIGDRSNPSLSVGIGSEAFNSSNREKLLVDAGTTSSYNVISGKGIINNYLQLNIQNQSNGTAASSDVVATADNGSETANFIDMGINSSTYSASGVLGGSNTAYLYATGNDFVIGNGTNNRALIFYTTVSGTGTERMRVTNTGLLPGSDNTYSLGANGTRWSAVWSANGTIQTSDARLKTNISKLNYGLKEILQLQPVSYDWKDRSGSHKIGLIAQEVKKIIPEVVSGDETKESLGMNYAEMVPVLINAVKELKAELEQAKKEIETLKKSK